MSTGSGTGAATTRKTLKVCELLGSSCVGKGSWEARGVRAALGTGRSMRRQGTEPESSDAYLLPCLRRRKDQSSLLEYAFYFSS